MQILGNLFDLRIRKISFVILHNPLYLFTLRLFPIQPISKNCTNNSQRALLGLFPTTCTSLISKQTHSCYWYTIYLFIGSLFIMTWAASVLCPFRNRPSSNATSFALCGSAEKNPQTISKYCVWHWWPFDFAYIFIFGTVWARYCIWCIVRRACDHVCDFY